MTEPAQRLGKALALGAALALAGCSEAPRVPAAPYPSALVAWRAADGFIAGSYADSALRFASGNGRTQFTWPGRAGATRPLQVLRIALDEPRHTLWVLGSDSVFACRMPLGRNPPSLRAGIAVPFSRLHPATCLPDIALDAAGAAYVTATHSPTLTVVRPQTYVSTTHRVTFPGAANPPWSLSGLAFTPGGGQLMAADAATGTLWRVDRVSFEGLAVRGVPALRGACGASPCPTQPGSNGEPSAAPV